MRNGGRILLAVLNLYVRIKIRVATFDTDHSVTESTQTINRCFNPEASGFCSEVKSAELAIDGVDVSGETIRLSVSEVSRSFFTRNVHKREMQVFNSMFVLLWTGGDSLISSLASVFGL